jgi:predicted DNA-binding transcriptional regulator AlpA
MSVEQLAENLVEGKQVAKILGVSQERLLPLAREGRIPIPLVLGPRTLRWRLRDLQAFVLGVE